MINKDPVSEEKFIVFQIGGETCALPVACVQEIVPMTHLSRPPGMPKVLLGLLDIGGQAIPVLRLDHVLNLELIRPGLYSHILIVRARDHLMGLFVDRAMDMISLPPESLCAVRNQEIFNGCAEAEIKYNGQVIHLLKLDQLLLEEERQVMGEFSLMAQKRVLGLKEDRA